MEQQFIVACRTGNFQDVVTILQGASPSFNINKRDDNDNDFTALHWACEKGHTEIAAVLIAHQNINLFQRNESGKSAFALACSRGRVSVVKLFLKLHCIILNEVDACGLSSVVTAALLGHAEILKWMIASGKEIRFDVKGGLEYVKDQANKQKHTEVVNLLDNFDRDANTTRLRLQKELGVVVTVSW